MDFQQRKRLYNLCQPDEPLEPSDARNVDIDALPHEIRGSSWRGTLAAEVELSDHPVRFLVAGLVGSGKSTELKRLAHHLSGSSSVGLLPVFVNAEDLLDLTSTIDIPDLVTAMLFETERAVLSAEGKDPQAALSEGYLHRFWQWLINTDVELGKGNLSVSKDASLTIELKTRPSLRQRVRAAVSTQLSEFLDDVRAEFGRLETRAVAAGYAGLLVIVDSLEKLRGTTSAWYDVLDSAEVLFRKGVPSFELPVHVIFTVPTALLTRIPKIRLLPMIKLRDRDGRRFQPGFDAARTLIERRVPANALAEIFGPAADERVHQLIAWSGGYPRELVRLLQLAIRDAADGPLSDEHFQRLFAQLVENYRALVTEDVIAWLVSVAMRRFMTVQDEQHRLAADRMLQNNVILYYANSQGWHDLHPAVYENPEIKAALQASE